LLGRAVLKVGDQRDEEHPNDIILAHKEAQDPHQARDPEAAFQGKDHRQEDKHHRVDIRVDQREEGEEERKKNEQQGFPDCGFGIDFFCKEKKARDREKRKQGREYAHSNSVSLVDEHAEARHCPVVTRQIRALVGEVIAALYDAHDLFVVKFFVSDGDHVTDNPKTTGQNKKGEGEKRNILDTVVAFFSHRS